MLLNSLYIVTSKFGNYNDDNLRLEIKQRVIAIQNRVSITARVSEQMIQMCGALEKDVKGMETDFKDSKYQWHQYRLSAVLRFKNLNKLISTPYGSRDIPYVGYLWTLDLNDEFCQRDVSECKEEEALGSK